MCWWGRRICILPRRAPIRGRSPPRCWSALGVVVILGHSERRQYFAETDDTVNRKLIAALKHHLVPIVCIGEHEEQRESGTTEQVLCRQISQAIHEIDAAKLRPMVVAYEPVWAIGTGKTATPAIAAEAHLMIRSEVARLVGRHVADALRILYGGSVKPENARALLSQPEIDGALVGGASLDPNSLTAIVKAGADSKSFVAAETVVPHILHQHRMFGSRRHRKRTTPQRLRDALSYTGHDRSRRRANWEMSVVQHTTVANGSTDRRAPPTFTLHSSGFV